MSRKVLIVGGGAIGQAAAVFILRRDPSLEVTVLERDPTYALASSSLSASSIRQQFSTPVNIALSQFSYDFMETLQAELGSDALGLRPCGYLFLAADQTQAARLEARTSAVRAAGGQVRRYEPGALAAAYPWLNPQGLTCAYQGLDREGWFDGYALVQALRGQAKSLGARFVTGEASGIVVSDGGASGVRLSGGEELDADLVLLAAGAWSRELAATLGADIPVFRRRRSVFVFDSPARISDLPILIDPEGVFVRRDGEHYLAVVSPTAENDPDDMPLDPDFSLFEEQIWPALAQRIPGFEQLRVVRAWAGYYEFNPIDHNGLVGRLGPEGLYVAAGFSGHGLMHCPGIGRGVAELMLTGGFETIELSPLRPERFAQGAPVCEEAVY